MALLFSNKQNIINSADIPIGTAVPAGIEPTDGPAPYFLDIISQWRTSIPSDSQWLVIINFDGANVIKNNLEDILNRYDTGSIADTAGWKISNKTKSILTSKRYNDNYDNSITGCIFANEVSIPSDSIKGGRIGLDYSGFQAPFTTEYRTAYSDLEISFMETNSSFVDYIMRPWMIASSYFGSIARDSTSPKSIKANDISIYFLAKRGDERSSARKAIVFYNCFPISVSGLSYSYTSSESIKNYKVKFAYDYYIIRETNVNSIPEY